MFSNMKREKYHPGPSCTDLKHWSRRIRSSFHVSVHCGPISLDTLVDVDILVFGGPQEKFSLSEVDILKSFIHGGGAVLILCHEGGEPASGTNINYLIEDYGISLNSDVLVRTTPHENLHPKETLVVGGVLNRVFEDKFGITGHPTEDEKMNYYTNKVLNISSSLMRFPSNEAEELIFVLPHGATLSVRKPAVTVVSSGKIAYPKHQPVCAVWRGDGTSGKGTGRIGVLGCGDLAGNVWSTCEDNSRILDFLLQWLAQDSLTRLHEQEIGDHVVGDYLHTPETAKIAGRQRGFLMEGFELPRDFTELFDDKVYHVNTDLISEASDLYHRLMVKKEILSLIAPQLECPLPPLQPSVFPPVVSELQPPALDMFDLEHAFARDRTRLANVYMQCAMGECDAFKTFVQKGAKICGFPCLEERLGSVVCRFLLSTLFHQLVKYKFQVITYRTEIII